MARRYGERRDTKCRFLSPDPLSFLSGLLNSRAEFPLRPGFLTGTSAVRYFPAPLAFSQTQARSGISPQSCFLTGTSAACIFPATLPSHGHKCSQVFPCTPAFSRAQARSAPRAHVRELLCVSQSSKEQLRRSRTESSAAPPATEELAGEARQVRPARAACGSVSTDFGLLTGGEAWRATGPPAPSSIIPARKFRLSSPFPIAHRRSRNFPLRYRLAHPGRSGGRLALQLPRASFPRGSSVYPPHSRPRTAEVGIFRHGTVSPSISTFRPSPARSLQEFVNLTPFKLFDRFARIFAIKPDFQLERKHNRHYSMPYWIRSSVG